MNSKIRIAAHATALLTIFIWGTTFISTKVLLGDFNPLEILFFRFVIGYVVLWGVYPRFVKCLKRRDELLFAAAGFCGVTLYFLMENIALIYTYASNVGIIVSVAPFFTAVMAHFLLKDERLHLRFFIGFVIAIFGISLISLNGSFVLALNPLGDLLAVLACVCWAVYSILMRKISELGYPVVGSTRRVFFYGLLFMLPALFLFDFQFDLERFADGINLSNILFLGFGASAVCFVTWNWSVAVLGAVQTSSYIYLVPAVTVSAAYLILNENITVGALIGALFTLVGLIVSERGFSIRKKV
ncbi:DMT family transporter [Paenibacillaceae bacterium]|nr:DMT family transporter [Paenibacillaceae bacterium]